MESTIYEKKRVLFFDIETSPLKAWVWRLGEQVVRHDQLVEGHEKYNIICLTWCWNDGEGANVIDWGYEEQDAKRIITKFDELVMEADIVIGKNSDKFDNRHMNWMRMQHKLPPMPDWVNLTDDLEKQMRKHFGGAIPSHSLDYLSKFFGLGGKDHMEFQDWLDIVEKHPTRGLPALQKMCDYGMKDVLDTRKVWELVEAYITPKYKKVSVGSGLGCNVCGHTGLVKNGTKYNYKDGTVYQRWYCKHHGGEAERVRIK